MAAPRPLVLVGDHGIDDVVALATAAGRMDVAVTALVAGAGNVDADTAWRNAAGMAALLGLDVPVGRGSGAGLTGPFPQRDPGPVHGEDGLGGCASRLPPPAGAPVAGIPLVRGEVVATGPLTDVARALASGQRVERVVWMGGCLADGNTTPAAEFNAWLDPEAADRVLTGVTPVAVVPLDVTRRIRLEEGDLEALDGGGEAARLCAALCRFRRARRGGLHDPVAVLAAVEPSLLSWEASAVRVDTTATASRGALVVDRRPGQTGPVQLAVDVDADAVRTRIVEAVLAAG